MKIKLIELFRNIKKNIVNFISISVFVFLSITFFQGLEFMGKGILNSIDLTFKKTNSYDVKFKTNSYLTNEDIEGIKSIEEVDEAEGFFFTTDTFNLNGKSLSASITSITNDVTKCHVIEGQLPSNDQEIAIYQGCAEEFDIKIGDEISFDNNNVTGYVQSLTRAYLDDKNVDLSGNSSNFKNETFKVAAIVVYGDIINHDTNAHPTNITTGTPIKACFYVNYSAFNPYITNNKFNGVYIKDNNLDKYQYSDDRYAKEVEKLTAKVNNYVEKNIDFSIDYQNVIQQHPELIPIIKQYFFINGLINEETYNNNELFISILNPFLNKLTQLEATYKISNKTQILGVIIEQINSGLFLNERDPLGGVFFIVSFLICFSVITRLVNKEAKLIGTKKALGFKFKDIFSLYLWFTLIAVFIAIIFGNVGSIVLEKIVIPITLNKAVYIILNTSYFNVWFSLIVALVTIIIMSLITYFACKKVISKKAITLLQGDYEVTKKNNEILEKSKILEKRSLFTRTVVRNFKNDGKRIFATIMGIVSSIALLITSFSLTFVVKDSFDKQFNDYIIFDTVVYVDNQNEENFSNMESFLNENDLSYSKIYRGFIDIDLEKGEHFVGYIYVYSDNESFNNLMHIDESKGNEKFNNKGFWFPESYQKEFKCSNHASVTMVDSIGNVGITETTGFYKYYGYQCAVFVDATTYEEVFGISATPNSYLVNRNKINIEEFEDKITPVGGYLFSYDFYGVGQKNIQVFNMVLNVLYALYSTATLLLSVFVVLNLFISNIEEKKREIITLMVNGYSRKKASKYIYLDSIFLTLISVILGIGFGLILSYFGQGAIESKFLYFIHKLNIKAILLAVPIVIFIVFIMTLISLREIKKFKLTDLNEK